MGEDMDHKVNLHKIIKLQESIINKTHLRETS